VTSIKSSKSYSGSALEYDLDVFSNSRKEYQVRLPEAYLGFFFRVFERRNMYPHILPLFFFYTTAHGGSIGSVVDEDRSELR
jgi:hypothetical protein